MPCQNWNDCPRPINQEEGKLSVHDPISHHIDVGIQNNHTPITIHHLLSHSSGIPELDGTVQPLVRKLGLAKKIDPMSSADDFLRHFNGASGEILYPPGERFYYNNDYFGGNFTRGWRACLRGTSHRFSGFSPDKSPSKKTPPPTNGRVFYSRRTNEISE